VPVEDRIEIHKSDMADSPPKPMGEVVISAHPVVQPIVNTMPILTQFPDLNEQQNLMLHEFSNKSKLNLEWSK
jgi:hypothetical protein